MSFSKYIHTSDSHTVAEITPLWASQPNHMWQKNSLWEYMCTFTIFIYTEAFIYLWMYIMYAACHHIIPSWLLQFTVLWYLSLFHVFSSSKMQQPHFRQNQKKTDKIPPILASIDHYPWDQFQNFTASLQDYICSSVYLWTSVPIQPLPTTKVLQSNAPVHPESKD